MARRILVADCFPPDLTPVLAEAGLQPIGETEVCMLADLDPNVDCDICFAADVSQPLPETATIAAYDGMLWSGTTLSALDDAPEMHRQLELMQSAFAASIPIFGICGGLQVAAAAAGGKVERNRKGLESGIARQIRLSDEGLKHPMFQFRQACFNAVCDHFDVVSKLPEGGTALANNPMAAIQAAAFRVGNSEFWGVQYHPDFGFAHLRSLASFRKDAWHENGLIQSNAEADFFAQLAARLEQDPNDRGAAWLMGIGDDVIDPAQRRSEVRAWLKEKIQ